MGGSIVSAMAQKVTLNEEIENKRWVESKLRSVRIVDWDRFVVGEWGEEQSISVYGWIDREDEYKDFINVIFWPESESLYHITSSEKHTEKISEQLHGDTSTHNECHRVEHNFNVSNAVNLSK